MKNYYKFIAIFSIFILSTALFQYDGVKNRVNASVIDNTFPQKYEMNIDGTKEFAISTLGTENTTTELEDSITIGEDEYVNIMQEEKFALWSAIAAKNDAGLYAIPHTDMFAIMKDGSPIVHMSTGAASASVEHAKVLADLFTGDGFENYEGISENIQTVIETGEDVSVELGDYEGYDIYVEDGWIFVLW